MPVHFFFWLCVFKIFRELEMEERASGGKANTRGGYLICSHLNVWKTEENFY